MNSIPRLADAFPGFALAFTLRAFALGILCAFALWLFRVRNSALQYAAWRLILFAMLALPVALAAMPVFSLPWLPAIRFASPQEMISRPFHLEYAKRSSSVETKALPRLAEPSRSTGSSIPWAVISLALYFLIAGMMICRLVLGWLLMTRAVSRMQRLDDSCLLERANRECERLGLLTFPEFRAGKIPVPVTLGWKTPTILLPAEWQEWATDKLDLVLAHELSHIQRRDYLIRMASALNKSLYWFHPLSWWLDKRLAELAEHLSDDAALAANSVHRERYAEILSDFASLLGRSSSRFLPEITMSVPAPGGRRIKRILDQRRKLCLNLNVQQKLAVFGLGIPALVLVGGAQTADHSQPPAMAQTGPVKPVMQISPAGSRHARSIPPAMFSRAYVDALQDILELEPSDVAALEHQLEGNPEDFGARLKLIAYHMRADRADLAESRSRKTDLVLWLVEHQPASEILGSHYGILSPGDLTPGQFVRTKQLWETATGPGQSDARIFWNAANFYGQLDRHLYTVSLERAVALSPNNEHYGLPLGLLYAGAVLTRDSSGADPELARRAKDILDTTQNPYILEPAVRLLQLEYNRSLMMGKKIASIGELAQRYFERAKMLDPDLDQLWIYPQVDPKMIGMFEPGARPPDDGNMDFGKAAKEIRRVPLDAFRMLPPGIGTGLRNRGCLVPQQAFSGEAISNQPQNVIQGEFFEKGKTGWAVLCSVNESSSILVFRDASDDRPEELAKSEDKNQLQSAGDGKIVYSREIRAVDRKFIMGHYRAYGGPQPPPIDHQGIDDAFVGKASVTYYWYRGEWRKLTGAD